MEENFTKQKPGFYHRITSKNKNFLRFFHKEEMRRKDRRAYRLLCQAKIDCYFYITDERLPYIEHGNKVYKGITGIRGFIKKWQKEKKLAEIRRQINEDPR